MGNKNNSLNVRMKENYENRAKTYLTRRCPVIIRLDGRSFHTFLKGFKKPYDEIFHSAMNATMKYLCENIQGCKIGYTQSDEITLFLTDYESLASDAWFDYNVQKMCSIAASMATLAFNRILEGEIYNYGRKRLSSNFDEEYYGTVRKKIAVGAMFDARVFNIPKEEVTICFVWRQKDATRNAIQMLGQTYFSQSQLSGKSNSDIQDMLMLEKGVNFNDMPVEFKRGTCCIRNYQVCAPYGNYMYFKDLKDGEWGIDQNIPIFTEDREYIERFI